MDAEQKIIAKRALEEAISQAGNQSKFAAAMGVKQQSVSLWEQNGFVPAERVVDAEEATEATGRRIARHKFRPDIFQGYSRARRRVQS